MADRKLQDGLSYPPRVFRAERAAAYLSIGTTTFLRLVSEGVLPKPIKLRGVTIWDRLDLDAAIDDLREGGENTIDKALRESDKI